MKKMICLLLCLALIMSFSVTVYADETVVPQQDENIAQQNDDQQDESQQENTHEHNWTSADTATCTQAGTITKTCGCGATETTESPAKGHSYGSAVKVDGTNHKSVCSACQTESVATHTWDSGTVTTEATCEQSGVKTYTCTGCGDTKTETIPMKTTHDYGEWTKTDTTHSRECDECKLPDSGNHSWKEETVKKPTCKEDGSKKKYCTVCDYSESIVLTKLTTHTYDSACDAQCNVCEAERTIEHTFTKVWSKDYKGHWHECTKCGEKKDFSKHVPGPAATEEKEQVCLTCAYVITPKKNHVHSYGSEWTSDEVGHWHACTNCKEEKDYVAHSFDDECDPECNTCGYKRENSHTYDMEGWMTSNFDHWNVCTVCGEESKREKHIPGEEATDKAPQVCTVCSFELAPILEHTHDFGSEWVQAQDSHWQACECGELSVPAAHVWDEGRENRDDTITYICADCGAEKTVEAPSSGFPWMVIILSILALVCLGGIVVLVIILKRGGVDEESDEDEEETVYEDSDPDSYSDAEEEEKMIDDYFASLDQDQYK